MKGMINSDWFFCDTYALIEMAEENNNYGKYLNKVLITSELNLMELYYTFLRVYDEKTADKYFDIYSGITVPFPKEIIRSSMKFKLENKNSKLSYVDCMGYVFAMSNGFKFLTGDKQFKEVEGVEFVK